MRLNLPGVDVPASQEMDADYFLKAFILLRL